MHIPLVASHKTLQKRKRVRRMQPLTTPAAGLASATWRRIGEVPPLGGSEWASRAEWRVLFAAADDGATGCEAGRLGHRFVLSI